MNKKFSTLLASALLAGGLFSSANALNFKQAVKAGADQYYYVLVSSTQVSDWSSVVSRLDANKEHWTNGLAFSNTDSCKSTWWQVVPYTTTVNTVVDTVGYKLINAETGLPLSVTVGEKTYDVVKGLNGKIIFPSVEGDKGYKGSSTLEADGYYFDLKAVAPVVQDAETLNDLNGGNFAMSIGYQASASKKYAWSAYTSFEGENVFAGNLYAVKGSTDGSVKLYKDSKQTKRIVLTSTNWSGASSALGIGNKFSIISEKDYSTLLNKDKIVAGEFKITVPAIVNGHPVEVVAVTEKGEVVGEVVVAVAYKDNGTAVNRLTVHKDVETSLADYTLQFDAANNGNTYIKLGDSNWIDTSVFIGKLWNIKMNDRILSPACEEEWVAASEVNLNGAEGLWLWNNKKGYFDNRESNKTWVPSGLRTTDEENVYVDDDNNLYEITPAGDPAPKGTTNGYLSYLTNDQLQQKAFFIGTLRSTGDTVYIAQSNGVLTFTLDKSEAVEFRLKRENFGNNTNKTEAWLVNEYTYLDDEELEQGDDIIKLSQYSITDAVSNKVLAYDSKNDYYVLVSASALINNADLETANYVFKEKGENVYNILKGVKSTDEYYYATTEKNYNLVTSDFCEDVTKLYGAHNTGRLVEDVNAYKSVQNDLFVVVDADAQQYRGDFSNEGALDTIKIFRNDDNSYVLYEKGTLLETKDEVLEGFLGLENIYDPQYAKVNPAVLADTAKHANTYRPQYMFAVETEVVPAGKYCDIHGANADCKDEHLTDTEGYIAGRYLVNLVDSAKAGRKDCVYQNYAGDNYYRLGFVAAKHMGDTLIIASSNKKIVVGDGKDQVCTFALKYVDGNRDAFTIETLYNRVFDKYGDVLEIDGQKQEFRGYVKFHNGVPVVTSQASEAEVFDLEVLENVIPTANETIAASAVTVIAGEGNVTIAGAAGKKVVIANILGQTIANTVLTSDNVTIAAPAGVVVVAVEGEAAVKAIVK